MGYLRRYAALSRESRLWLAAWACVGFAYLGVHAVLVNLYLVRLGYGPEFVGIFWGVGQALWAALALPGAGVGRRMGHGYAMALGTALNLAGSVLLLAAGRLAAPEGGPWLLGAWMVFWVGASLFVVNGPPFLMAVTRPEERGHALAAQQAVMAISAFAGGILAGWLPGLLAARAGLSLDAATPYRDALWLAPPAYLLATLVILRSGRCRIAFESGAARAASAPPLRLLLFFGLLVLLQAIGEGATRSFFTIYLDDTLGVPTVSIGVLLGTAQLAPVLGALATPVLLQRRGPGGAHLLSVLGLVLGLVLLASIPHWLASGVAYMVIVIALAISNSARTIQSQEAVAPLWRGTMSAVLTVGLAAGWSAASTAGGVLASASDYRTMFLAAAALPLGAAILLGAYLRRAPVVS